MTININAFPGVQVINNSALPAIDVVNNSAFGTGSNGWTDPGTGQLFTTSSVLIGGNLIVTGSITGSIQQTIGGLSFLVGGANVTVTSQSNGQVIIAASTGSAVSTIVSAGEGISVIGTTSAPVVGLNLATGTGLLLSSGSGTQVSLFNTKTGDDKASYVVTSTTASLPNASALAAGEGLSLSGATLSLNLVGGNAISLSSGSGTQVSIAVTQAGVQSSVSGTWRDTGSAFVTTASVSVDPGKNRAVSSIGTDVVFFVSGTVNLPNPTSAGRQVPVFGGDVFVSGVLTAGGMDPIAGGKYHPTLTTDASGTYHGDLTKTNQFTLNLRPLVGLETTQFGLYASQSAPTQFNANMQISAATTISRNALVVGSSGFRVDAGLLGVNNNGLDNYVYVSGTLGIDTHTASTRRTVFATDVVFSGSLVCTNVASITGSYTLDSNVGGGTLSDGTILCAPGSACTVTLNKVPVGRSVIVKDSGFTGTTRNISITGSGFNGKIENSTAAYVINLNGASVVLEADGSNWFVVSAYNGTAV